MAVIATAILLLLASATAWPLLDRSLAGEPVASTVFWILVTVIASAFPVQTPRGATVSVSAAPILASALLGGPTVGALVALIGSTERRELTGRVPWYGVLYNHATLVIPATLAGVVAISTEVEVRGQPAASLLVALLAGLIYFAANEFLSALAVSTREQRALRSTLVADVKGFGVALVGLIPIAWLMALAYSAVGPWVIALFALPLYATRASYASVVEIRNMFTQTVTALASAIDARDPSTKKHSEHVSSIGVEIGEVLQLGEADLERLEWAGLLHDIGKIGIPDSVLLKPDRLTREEREEMNRHPQRGWAILAPVERLKRERELILHHHQWFNGSGYPRVNDAGDPVDPRDAEQ